MIGNVIFCQLFCRTLCTADEINPTVFPAPFAPISIYYCICTGISSLCLCDCSVYIYIYVLLCLMGSNKAILNLENLDILNITLILFQMWNVHNKLCDIQIPW